MNPHPQVGSTWACTKNIACWQESTRTHGCTENNGLASCVALNTASQMYVKGKASSSTTGHWKCNALERVSNNRAFHTTSPIMHLALPPRNVDEKRPQVLLLYFNLPAHWEYGHGETVCVCVCVCVWVCVHACPVPLVRVWLIHETEFVCGMPARHSCCMQMRKEWKWICKSEIKTARGHDYKEHRKRKK